jgi:hypothetical protein
VVVVGVLHFIHEQAQRALAISWKVKHMSKVKHESKAARCALQAAIAATGKAAESAAASHVRLVHELSGLMRGGLSVQAVQAEIKTTKADEVLAFRVSSAQFVPLMASALGLSGAPKFVFGKDGMASLFARAAQNWKKSGAGEKFADEARALVAGASSWDVVRDALAESAEWKPEPVEPSEGEGEGEPVKVAKGAKIDDLTPEELAGLLTLSAVSTWLAHLDATGFVPSEHQKGTLKNVALVARKLSTK